jgi:hypothetical protein
MILVPDPGLQVSFATALRKVRTLYLQDALSETVAKMSVPEIDKQLAEYVPAGSLAALAAHGLRGELMFPVPLVLAANPWLLGYYRLLYGFSQKEFYTSTSGLSRFKRLESRGAIRAGALSDLPELCGAMCKAGALLLAAIGSEKVSAGLLDDLTLLTLGPQMRGGANVQRGLAGIATVFNAIHEIVKHAIVDVSETKMQIKNAAGRTVLIEFAADPDIIIQAEMHGGAYRKVIAIEVKAGTDFSNIHNRIGEAEKSHQKAKADGYVECWTVVNVDKIDMQMARQESPSTNQFYLISDIVSANGANYLDFRDRLISLTGVTSQ